MAGEAGVNNLKARDGFEYWKYLKVSNLISGLVVVKRVVEAMYRWFQMSVA